MGDLDGCRRQRIGRIEIEMIELRIISGWDAINAISQAASAKATVPDHNLHLTERQSHVKSAAAAFNFGSPMTISYLSHLWWFGFADHPVRMQSNPTSSPVDLCRLNFLRVLLLILTAAFRNLRCHSYP